MRVAVIGATGVFGSRLADLLSRDGHDVIACARHAGGTPGVPPRTPGYLGKDENMVRISVDRSGDLSPLWAAVPDVVVDAAGPFAVAGADPYRVARACIGRGVHYLDLADDAGFCAGIAALDAAARTAGVVVLSGLSSVPALSSAAVAALAAGMDGIEVIDAAILPGNRAPRGRAVVEGILARAGLPFQGWEAGRRVPVRNWSGSAPYVLAPGMRRRGWQIEVPDQRLFPAAFGARTVVFRAGLELGVMGWGLAALAWLRGRMGFGMPGWLVGLVFRAAVLLGPFGTDAGGMLVAVTGRAGGAWVRRDWRLVVRRGEGPYVPGVAVRAVLRGLGAVAPGARPAVAVVPLAGCEAALQGLAFEVARGEAPVVPLFARVPGFDGLPAEVRATHDHAGPRRFAGEAEVERGRGRAVRAIAALFGFPAAGAAVPVVVEKRPFAGGEVWVRAFAGRRFRSVLRWTGDGMTERFGPFTFRLGLRVQGDALHFPVRAGWLLGVPLPRFLLPVSETREHADGGRFRFDVALSAPMGLGLVVRYRGWLAPA
jgi:hypothetical protein